MSRTQHQHLFIFMKKTPRLAFSLACFLAVACSNPTTTDPDLPDQGTYGTPVVESAPSQKQQLENQISDLQQQLSDLQSYENANDVEILAKIAEIEARLESLEGQLAALQAPEQYSQPLEDKLVPYFGDSFVDGRQWKKEAWIDPTSKVSSQVEFSYSDAPAPMRTRNTELTVASLSKLISTPAVDVGRDLHTLSLTTQDAAIEAELMKNGIDIVDRNHLSDIQSEFFIQDAALSKGAIEPTIYMVGNSPFETLYSVLKSFWIEQDGEAHPLISGRNVEESKKLQPGKVVPAQAMLTTTDIYSTETELVFNYQRPTATSIPYVPSVIKFNGVEVTDIGYWQQDEDDPFHLIYKDGTTYYDPVKGALWTITDAYTSRIVSRGDFLSRRMGSNTTHEYCSICSAHTGSETKKYGEQYKNSPVEWTCLECEAKYGVVYFDGYYDIAAAPPVSQYTIVKWAWRPLDSGIYPALTPGSNLDTEHGSFYLSEELNKQRSLEEYAAAENILRSFHSSEDWAFIDRGQAVIVSEEDLNYLEKIFGYKVFPRVTSDGSLMYELSAEPYVSATVTVPIVRAGLNARMVISEESRVGLAGTLAMSYRNLLNEPFKFTCDSNGADLSGWPNAEEQLGMLTEELIRRIVGYLK